MFYAKRVQEKYFQSGNHKDKSGQRKSRRNGRPQREEPSRYFIGSLCKFVDLLGFFMLFIFAPKNPPCANLF